MVYIRYFWQGDHQTYGHVRCIYTDLANPLHTQLRIDHAAQGSVTPNPHPHSHCHSSRHPHTDI